MEVAEVTSHIGLTCDRGRATGQRSAMAGTASRSRRVTSFTLGRRLVSEPRARLR